MIGRATDGMPLVGTHDASEAIFEFTSRAKDILKSLNHASPARCTIEVGTFYFHYIIEDNICYLTLVAKSYPKQLAFQYLETLHGEFFRAHGARVNHFSRPYQAITFDPLLAKIRREFLDPRSANNMKKLSDNLADIQHVMKKNIQDVITRGDKLDNLGQRSSTLVQEAKRFHDKSRWMNIVSAMKSYAPVVALVLILLAYLYFKFF